MWDNLYDLVRQILELVLKILKIVYAWLAPNPPEPPSNPSTFGLYCGAFQAGNERMLQNCFR